MAAWFAFLAFVCLFGIDHPDRGVRMLCAALTMFFAAAAVFLKLYAK